MGTTVHNIVICADTTKLFELNYNMIQSFGMKRKKTQYQMIMISLVVKILTIYGT